MSVMTTRKYLMKKMSAKLIVQKYESGINLKSLYMTIIGDGDNTSEIKFSGWYDDKTDQIKKEDEKSSRLIVKVTSENECSNFNLDACAQEVIDNDMQLISTTSGELDNNHTTNIYASNDYQINHQKYFLLQSKSTNHNRNHFKENTSVNLLPNVIVRRNCMNNEVETVTNASECLLSPLEYSLEKVKENNARIMENIQLLNRTLNYTKKKEICNVVPKTMRPFPCNICGKCFVYETGLKRHYSMRHTIPEDHPRWQTVWTCLECFQVWPRHDLALKHVTVCCKTDDLNFVREFKTSSLLQCEFCEKVFTSIPRLLRHSSVHTTANNYECNACHLAFPSYKTAEQHWLNCPWLKLCYRFTLPKLLLCNTCDRKFRNYEQLYNHRYKAGHYTTKTHSTDLQSVIRFVYQCESCGNWFPSIPSLQEHRTHFHPIGDEYPSVSIHCLS